MYKQNFTFSILIVITFMVSLYGQRILNNYTGISFSNSTFKLIIYYAWWIIPTLTVLGILYGFKNIPKDLGLNKGLLKGFIFSIITVLPMLISSAIIGKVSEDLDFGTLLHKTFIAGFFEEYLFRGFMFGILFTKLRWGFIPASILGGVIFGMGHLYQGSTLIESIGVFAVTTLGAVWFAWLYIEWKKNLWVPIFVHVLMNLSWILFEVSDTALGGIVNNIFRVISIILSIVITILYFKKRGLFIGRKNLIINKNEVT